MDDDIKKIKKMKRKKINDDDDVLIAFQYGNNMITEKYNYIKNILYKK
jgi:hypothetical protein